MRTLDELFEELAAVELDAAAPIDVDALHRRVAHRRRTRRLSGLVGGIVAVALAGVAVLALWPTDDTRVESIDPGPTTTASPDATSTTSAAATPATRATTAAGSQGTAASEWDERYGICLLYTSDAADD